MTIQLSLQKEVLLKYLYNPATDSFEALEPTLRERFALGGRVNFDKGSPFPITDDVLKQIKDLVEDTNLNLKQIGDAIGYGTEKRSLTIDTPVMEAYTKKYGKPKIGRFKPSNLAKAPEYVQYVIDSVKEKGVSATARDLNTQNKTIRNVLKQFAPELIKPANEPGPDTGAKAQKKRRILKEKEGTRQLSDSEKLFNKEQEKIVRDLNNDFKKNPSKVLNNSKLINLLNLKLEKGSIISKNKTKKQILESINRQGGLLDIEHIDDIATGKKNVQYPVNRQITTYNVNSGFLRSVSNYVNGPNADPAKIENIEKTLKQYGLRVKTNKGIIGADPISAKDNVKRNLDAAGIKYNDVIKPPKSLTKKGLKFAAKQIPLASFLIGTSDAATAFKQGVRNPLDLYTAYEVSPEVALKQKAIREDPTGKLLKEEISNLPEITTDDQVAGLLEESGSPYMQFLQGGGQLTPEEFNQLQSIPQSDRPLTGELDLPEMDQTMMAAQGGRVGFKDGSPNPVIQELLSGLNNTEVMDNILKNNTPGLEESMFGTKEESNLLQRLNQTLDPRAFPYYAAQITKGVALAPEFAARLTLAAPKALGDLAQGKSGVGAEFAENIEPKVTQKQVIERFGLQKILDDMDQDITGSQRTVGQILKMGGESLGPATGVGYFASAGRAANQIRKELQKYTGTATAAKELEKSVEEKAASLQMTRREFNSLLAGGGIIGLVKALGLDSIFPAAKTVAQKAAPEIITKGGTPKYFFDFVNLIKTKGDDITEKAATVERQKVYDYNGYTMYEDITTGKISIRKDTEGGATYSIGDGEYETVDGIIRKEEINYEPSETILNEKGKPVKVPDQYDEATVRPDEDGGEGDFEVGLDSIDDILELLSKDGKTYSKEELLKMGIDADALGNYPTGAGSIPEGSAGDANPFKPKKAGGGIIKLAGDDSGPPPKSGPTPHGLPYIAKNVRPIKERK
jgi:hypothetical protein